LFVLDVSVVDSVDVLTVVSDDIALVLVDVSPGTLSLEVAVKKLNFLKLRKVKN
jgi:hypothetical protein